MKKNRWIFPVGTEGRIEISVSSERTCSIQTHTTNESEPNTCLLTHEELFSYVEELERALRRLNELEQEERKKETATVEDALAEKANSA